MIMSGVNNPCYPNAPPYGLAGDDQEPPVIPPPANQPGSSFLYNLSILRDKVHQIQSLATIFLSSDHSPEESTAAFAVPTIGTLIQEIIITASSMAFACQQISLSSTVALPAQALDQLPHQVATRRNMKASHEERPSPGFFSDDHPMLDELYNNKDISFNRQDNNPQKREASEEFSTNYDIIEMAASDLLAKYTHYCHVCGKGFKRDANLRMHMRAHGDEYKSTAALSNPMKGGGCGTAGGVPKYSCPHEGCRWNKNHAKFQPLKSMICVKNHYKRSHCPKIYVCKRCNQKQFSVLSDLRTHEKHCGDLKWQCSCGTTFSRKDKLMGHISLFIGHTPAANSLNKIAWDTQV